MIPVAAITVLFGALWVTDRIRRHRADRRPVVEQAEAIVRDAYAEVRHYYEREDR